MTALELCPFCGSDYVKLSARRKRESKDYRCYCGVCGAYGRKANTESEAYRLWNRRYEVLLVEKVKHIYALFDIPIEDSPSSSKNLEEYYRQYWKKWREERQNGGFVEGEWQRRAMVAEDIVNQDRIYIADLVSVLDAYKEIIDAQTISLSGNDNDRAIDLHDQSHQ